MAGIQVGGVPSFTHIHPDLLEHSCQNHPSFQGRPASKYHSNARFVGAAVLDEMRIQLTRPAASIAPAVSAPLCTSG